VLIRSVKVYSKITKMLDRILSGIRKRQIRNHDFSIICNNCWGGYVYRRYGLPYLSPTVGLYFYADDFVKLCNNLRQYMEAPLEFIPYTQSKYKEEIERRGQQSVPIGKLLDVEVVFLHYATPEEARDKWERRVQRINYNNLIFKFSKMNLCGEAALDAFDQIECNKKICFLPPEESRFFKCGIPFYSAKGKAEISNDSAEYGRYLNLTRMINAKKVCGKHMD